MTDTRRIKRKRKTDDGVRGLVADRKRRHERWRSGRVDKEWSSKISDIVVDPGAAPNRCVSIPEDVPRKSRPGTKIQERPIAHDGPLRCRGVNGNISNRIGKVV